MTRTRETKVVVHTIQSTLAKGNGHDTIFLLCKGEVSYAATSRVDDLAAPIHGVSMKCRVNEGIQLSHDILNEFEGGKRLATRA